MQKIGSCGEGQFTPATLINQEKPVEEEEEEEEEGEWDQPNNRQCS